MPHLFGLSDEHVFGLVLSLGSDPAVSDLLALYFEALPAFREAQTSILNALKNRS